MFGLAGIEDGCQNIRKTNPEDMAVQKHAAGTFNV